MYWNRLRLSFANSRFVLEGKYKEKVPIETTLQALKIAKAKGVFTILNPAPAPPTGLPDEVNN